MKGITNIHEFHISRFTIRKPVFLKLILEKYPKITRINIYDDSLKNINEYHDYLKEIQTRFRYIEYFMPNAMGVFKINPPIHYESYVENKLIF
jgi:hypothetical protein